MTGETPTRRDAREYLFVGGPYDQARLAVVHRSNPDLMTVTPEPPDEIYLDPHGELQPMWFSRGQIVAAQHTYRRVDHAEGPPQYVYQEFSPDTGGAQ